MDKLRGLYRQKRRNSKGSEGTASLCDDSLSSCEEEQPVQELEDLCLEHDNNGLVNSHIVVVTQNNKKKKTKSVRFSPIDRVVYFGLFDQSADNPKALWYTNAELTYEKRVAKHFIACSRSQLFQADASALSNAFYTAHSLSRTMDSLETNEFLCNADSSLSSTAARTLLFDASCCQQSTRYLTRGLEDSLCQDVAGARNALARESRLIVQELYSLDDDDNMVAREYQDLSRTSLILARLQGMADAHDVGVDMMMDNVVSKCSHDEAAAAEVSIPPPVNNNNGNNTIIEV